MVLATPPPRLESLGYGGAMWASHEVLDVDWRAATIRDRPGYSGLKPVASVRCRSEAAGFILQWRLVSE
jgi:hypothetical protein